MFWDRFLLERRINMKIKENVQSAVEEKWDCDISLQ
jgi:hypothetical protein